MMIPFYQFPTSDHPRFYGAEPATFWTHCICSLTQHRFAVQLIHFENVFTFTCKHLRRGCVFSRSAATNHCTDHRIYVVIPRQHNTYHQPMLTEEHVILPSSILTIEGQPVIFTILSSQLATPLHISRALDIQLDARTTPIVRETGSLSLNL